MIRLKGFVVKKRTKGSFVGIFPHTFSIYFIPDLFGQLGNQFGLIILFSN